MASIQGTAPQKKLKRLRKAQDVDLAADCAQWSGDQGLEVRRDVPTALTVSEKSKGFQSEGDEVDLFHAEASKDVGSSENLNIEHDFGRRGDDSKVHEEHSTETVPISELGTESTKRKPVEDDDDDEPIASVIRKKCKSSGKQMEESNADADGAAKARRTKKSTKKELEEMHAESQRLLRETKQVAFEPAPIVHVPMSGLLAKLRLRKIQLGWKPVASASETKLHSRIPASPGSINDGSEMEFDPEDAEEPASREACTSEDDSVPVDVEVNAGVSTSGNDLESYVGTSNAHEEPKCSLVKCSTTFRQPLEDTQDIFSDSLSSPFEDDMHKDDVGPSMNLHLDTDTQTQDDDIGRLLIDDDNKEETPAANRPFLSFGTKPQIMALIDDEAEVEDEEILAKDSDDEDDDDAELLEIVGPADPEKPADISKRAELHRQWLEQQDEAQTDDILCRLKGNLKPRGIAGEVASILDDEETIIPCSSSIESKKQTKEKTYRSHYEVDALNGSNGAAVNMPNTTEADDEIATSDDEETERVILRQRLLEAAEQQELFTAPAEDEASREMLGLIKKLNVVTSTKSKPAQAPPEIRGFGTSLHGTCKSKPAFLNRVVPSSSVHKQTVCTNSRSFIFGRDDSNGDEMANDGCFSNAVGKENVVVKTIEVQSSTQAKICAEKGPSLFSILRQQAADLSRPSNDRIVMTDRISIFSKFSKRDKAAPKWEFHQVVIAPSGVINPYTGWKFFHEIFS